MNIEQAKAAEKSLRWVVNQIPNDLGNSEEEKMLKCIRLYCEQGANTIKQLLNSIYGNKDVCKHCGYDTFFNKQSGPHLGQYCAKCGKWNKWISQYNQFSINTEDNDIPF